MGYNCIDAHLVVVQIRPRAGASPRVAAPGNVGALPPESPQHRPQPMRRHHDRIGRDWRRNRAIDCPRAARIIGTDLWRCRRFVDRRHRRGANAAASRPVLSACRIRRALPALRLQPGRLRQRAVSRVRFSGCQRRASSGKATCVRPYAGNSLSFRRASWKAGLRDRAAW